MMNVNLNKLLTGDITFSEFLEENIKIDECFNSMDIINRERLAKIIVDYIIDNKHAFSANLIPFLTTSKNNYIYNFEHYIKITLNQVKNLNYIRKWYLCKKIFCAHKRSYSRSNLYCTFTVNDLNYSVDDNIIDEALEYIQTNNLIDSLVSMNYICKGIATGELTNIKKVNK